MKLISQLTKPEGSIIIKSIRGTFVISCESILRLEADGAYTNVRCKDGQRILWCAYLGEIEPKLDPEYFIRTHKSVIINACEMLKYTDGRSGKIEQTDGVVLRVSQRRRKEFLKRLYGEDFELKRKMLRKDARALGVPVSSWAS